MALHIKEPKADRLARELAGLTGENLTEAVTKALEERLEREHAAKDKERRIARLNEIAREMAKLPVLDGRTADEILGYNEYGHFD